MNETITPAALHHVLTILENTETSSRALAECPRRHAQAVDVCECAACDHARGFVGALAPPLRGTRVSPNDGGSFVLCRCATDDDSVDQGTVAAWMTRDVVCVRADVHVNTITWLFLKHGVSGVPVVDAEDRPIGVVSKTDVIRAYVQGRLARDAVHDADALVLDGLAHGSDVFTSPARFPCTARDVMTAPAMTVTQGELVSHAAERLAARKLHRAVVVGASGCIVGLISALDLLRALADR